MSPVTFILVLSGDGGQHGCLFGPGQGDGVLYTPIQLFFGIDFHAAAATMIFLVMVTSLSSTLVFRQAGVVDWPMALPISFVAGAAVATVAGVLVEVPAMPSVCGICKRTRRWFPQRPGEASATDREAARPSRRRPRAGIPRWFT